MIRQEKDDGRADRRLPTPTHGRSLSPNRALWLCVSRPPRRVLPALALLLTACGGDDRAPVPDAEDAFVIHGATIVDGTGRAGFTGSVRVVGGTIAEVVAEGMDGAAIAPRDGERAYDASGLVLAPGFVDTHSHHEGGLLDEPTALAAVSQGITTIVVGQDGGSPFPIADFFAALEAAPAAVNVASYAGHGTLRRQVMGDDFRREATPDEIASMQALLDTELASGVLGLSTGLEYDPGIYSTTEEVVALAGTAAARGGRYISHMRSEDRGLLEAVEETIRIAERARLPVQISHFKLAARSLWGQAAEILARLDAARARGLEITADVYPYEYWQSSGLEAARIPAGSRLKSYRTARSAFPAVGLDPTGPCRESGKTGCEWRDSGALLVARRRGSEGQPCAGYEKPPSRPGRSGGILAHGSSPCSPSNGTEWLPRHLRSERELRRGERILFVGTASQRDEFERAFK